MAKLITAILILTAGILGAAEMPYMVGNSTAGFEERNLTLIPSTVVTIGPNATLTASPIDSIGLAAVAITGNYSSLFGAPTTWPWSSITATPTTLAGYGITDAATASQGGLADSAVQPSRTIIAGTGLSGGGNLTANVTLSLDDTAVTAGSYGSNSTVPAITVDAQGRITGAANATITPSSIGAATLAQGTLADSAVQPGTSPTLAGLTLSGNSTELAKIAKTTTMASASSITLSSAAGEYIEITGNTTITSFGIGGYGQSRTLIFREPINIRASSALKIPGIASGSDCYLNASASMPLTMRFISLTGGWVAASSATHWDGLTVGNATIARATLGLDQIDNTSDADKPISDATQAAIDALVPQYRTITAESPMTINGSSSANMSANITVATGNATDTARGLVRLSTDAEAVAATNNSTAVPPSGLSAWWTAAWATIKSASQTITGNWTFGGLLSAGNVTVTGNQSVQGNFVVGDSAADTATIHATTTADAPVSLTAQPTLPTSTTAMTQTGAALAPIFSGMRIIAANQFGYANTGNGSFASASYFSAGGYAALDSGTGSISGQYQTASIPIATRAGVWNGILSTREIWAAAKIVIPTNSGTEVQHIIAVGSPLSGGVISGKGFSVTVHPNQSTDLDLAIHDGTTLHTISVSDPYYAYYLGEYDVILHWYNASTLDVYVRADNSGLPILVASYSVAAPLTGAFASTVMTAQNYTIATTTGRSVFYIYQFGLLIK